MTNDAIESLVQKAETGDADALREVEIAACTMSHDEYRDLPQAMVERIGKLL